MSSKIKILVLLIVVISCMGCLGQQKCKNWVDSKGLHAKFEGLDWCDGVGAYGVKANTKARLVVTLKKGSVNVTVLNIYSNGENVVYSGNFTSSKSVTITFKRAGECSLKICGKNAYGSVHLIVKS